MLDGKPHVINSCPRQQIPASIWTVIDYATAAEQGHWPVGGGLLDQSHWFLCAARFVWSEAAYWKSQNVNHG